MTHEIFVIPDVVLVRCEAENEDGVSFHFRWESPLQFSELERAMKVERQEHFKIQSRKWSETGQWNFGCPIAGMRLLLLQKVVHACLSSPLWEAFQIQYPQCQKPQRVSDFTEITFDDVVGCLLAGIGYS